MATVTSTSPVFEGAATVRDVEEIIVAVPAVTVPNLTVTPGTKFVPVTVIVVPLTAALGLTAVTVGAA